MNVGRMSKRISILFQKQLMTFILNDILRILIKEVIMLIKTSKKVLFRINICILHLHDDTIVASLHPLSKVSLI